MSDYHILAEHNEDGFRYVSASSNGWAFRVTATRLPKVVAAELGGKWLVSVVSPWSAAYPMQTEGALHWAYCWEKLGDSGWENPHTGRPSSPSTVNALLATVGHALGRSYLPLEPVTA